MCAKAINQLGTWTKVKAFQVTSTGLIPILTSLPDMRVSKFSQSRGLGNRKKNVRLCGERLGYGKTILTQSIEAYI